MKKRINIFAWSFWRIKKDEEEIKQLFEKAHKGCYAARVIRRREFNEKLALYKRTHGATEFYKQEWEFSW